MNEDSARRQTCTDHCPACGRHFHGTGAFESHCHGEHGARYCEAPEAVVDIHGSAVLEVWTSEGSCDKVAGCYEDGRRVRYAAPVTIWRRVMSATQKDALERLQELRSKKSDAVTPAPVVLAGVA